jgi:DNA-binding NarL/FixJ family response regulator
VAESGPIRVVVGEDQPITRQGVVSILEAAGFEVVGTAPDAEDLVRKARAHKPDIIVTDIQMPPTSTDDGLQAAKAIRAELPGTGVMVLSQFLEEDYAVELLTDGASGVGYMLKDRIGDVTNFTDAVRRVANGGSALDPSVVQQMVERPRIASPIDELTPREKEVLGLMAEGRSNQAIAEELVVTVAAVERHMTSILSKLDLPPDPGDHRRVLAVLQYLQR